MAEDKGIGQVVIRGQDRAEMGQLAVNDAPGGDMAAAGGVIIDLVEGMQAGVVGNKEGIGPVLAGGSVEDSGRGRVEIEGIAGGQAQAEAARTAAGARPQSVDQAAAGLGAGAGEITRQARRAGSPASDRAFPR